MCSPARAAVSLKLVCAFKQQVQRVMEEVVGECAFILVVCVFSDCAPMLLVCLATIAVRVCSGTYINNYKPIYIKHECM